MSTDDDFGLVAPSPALRDRLARRIREEAGEGSSPASAPEWNEPAWHEVAPGIFCKLLANDPERKRVSMLVHLMPNVSYPAHNHGGLEELHLLDGELWIEDRKLYPGDYSRAEAPGGDERVWSETGCTCVLITSTEDVLS